MPSSQHIERTMGMIAAGIIFELSRMGGEVPVQQFVAKFAYSASRVIPAAAARTPKNQRKEGGKFPA